MHRASGSGRELWDQKSDTWEITTLEPPLLELIYGVLSASLDIFSSEASRCEKHCVAYLSLSGACSNVKIPSIIVFFWVIMKQILEEK